GPGTKDALGGDVLARVQQRIEDAEAQVGHADLVDVGEGEGERQGDVAMVLHDLVPLAADIAGRLLNPREQLAEGGLVDRVVRRHHRPQAPGTALWDSNRALVDEPPPAD